MFRFWTKSAYQLLDKLKKKNASDQEFLQFIKNDSTFKQHEKFLLQCLLACSENYSDIEPPCFGYKTSFEGNILHVQYRISMGYLFGYVNQNPSKLRELEDIHSELMNMYINKTSTQQTIDIDYDISTQKIIKETPLEELKQKVTKSLKKDMIGYCDRLKEYFESL